MVKRACWISFLVFWVFPAFSLTVRPLNIEEMITGADRIFLGQVTGVDSEHIPGKPPAIVTTFKVLEPYKGTLGKEVTIRQLARSGPKGKIALMIGLPKFSTGESVVVFLTGESSLGFSSALGMRQGLFRVLGKDADPARMMLINGHGNRKLLSELSHPATRTLAKSIRTSKKGAKHQGLSLKDLRQLIQVRLEEEK